MDSIFQKIFITVLINNFKLWLILFFWLPFFFFLYCFKTDKFLVTFRQLLNLPNAVTEKVISSIVKAGVD